MENSRELMIKTLNLQKTARSPVTPNTPEQNIKCLINTGKDLKWQ